MLIIVRHGRTTANASGLLQGRMDLPLDELGQTQAAAIARHLGTVDRIVSSPLQRAVATASAIGPDVEIDDRLIELDYGIYDGRPQGDVALEVWERWREDDTFTPPGGESLRDVDTRVVAALESLSAEAMHHDVVVVSHVSPIKSAIAWTLGCPVGDVTWRCRLDVAAICRIGITPRGPMLLSFNETAHLRP